MATEKIKMRRGSARVVNVLPEQFFSATDAWEFISGRV